MPQALKAHAIAGVHADGPNPSRSDVALRGPETSGAGSIEARQLGFALPVPAHENHATQGA
jgi:hypothetical protein